MAHAPAFDSVAQTKTREHGLEERIAALAERQYGVITRRQLLEIGVGSGAITHRLQRHRLQRLHRGVYAVGHRRLTQDGFLFAAVLASGEDALVTHRSAGAVWQIRRWAGPIELTVPWMRRTPGLTLYESAIPPDERTHLRGIPVTTVARTLLDLATVLRPTDLELAIEQAEALRLSDRPSLPDLLERYPRRQGTRVLRSILDEADIGEAVTRSELEDAFLRFIADTGLPPPPRVNFWLELGGRSLQLDFYWPAQALVAELDGYATHGTRAAFERDRRRDRSLAVAGLRVVRVTWRQLHRERAQLEADLRKLLCRGGR